MAFARSIGVTPVLFACDSATVGFVASASFWIRDPLKLVLPYAISVN